jgi:hypothetical protein
VRTVRRAIALVLAALIAIAVVAMKPWATDNSIRQLRLMAASERVRNFQTMDEVFPSHPIRKAAIPHRFELGERPLPQSF